MTAAYSAWMEAEQSKNGRSFAEQNFLSDNGLRTAMEIKQQLAEELSALGFLPAGITVWKLRKVLVATKVLSIDIHSKVVMAFLHYAKSNVFTRVTGALFVLLSVLHWDQI